MNETGERLRALAAAGDMEGLEEAWLEALEDPGPAQTFLHALDALVEEERKERALALLPIVLETYEARGRSADALAVARYLAAYQPREPALRRALVRHIRGCFGDEPWVEAFLRASRIPEAVPLDEGLRRFDAFAHYKPGAGVKHSGGWGAGVIEGFDAVTGELKVRFEDGVTRNLPLSSAVDTLPPLDPDDLRIMLLARPEALREEARTDPAGVIRKALVLRPDRRMTAAQVKQALLDRVVPSEEWTRWWAKAKRAAARDPYLEVTGGSRPVFFLRDEPLSIEAEARARVEEAGSLAEAVTRAREYVGARVGPELEGTLLDMVRRRVEAGFAAGLPIPELLDGLLFLEECGCSGPRAAGDLLREAFSGSTGREGEDRAVALLSSIPTAKGRLRALHAVPEVFPDRWTDLLVSVYPRLPRDLLDPAAEMLLHHGCAGRMADVLKKIMEQPWKAPWPLFFMARRFAAGAMEGEAPGLRIPEVVLALLRCLESPLFHATGTAAARREIVRRFEEILFDPRRRLLQRFMEEGTREELHRAFNMVHLTSKLPEVLQNELVSGITHRYPDLKQEEEKPFWEEDAIFCTRKGIDRKEKELRRIMEERLPEVSRAIGRAADFGDLSENAEWTAALEDQRILTEKAARMEADLRKARILENQTLPAGVVAPGTRVTIARVEEGTRECLTILGPWDVGPPGVVSYTAPAAKSLLGRRKGERVRVELPERSYEVHILEVEPLALEE